MADDDARLLLEHFGETFPVIRPLSQIPNRVTLAELYPHLKEKKGTSRLTSPDTAVIAEISSCFVICSETRSIVCSLRESRVLLCIRNSFLSSFANSTGLMLFPRSRIAIKSGLFRTLKPSKDYTIQAIYVACPEAIEFLGLAEEDESKVREDLNLAARASHLMSFGDSALTESKYIKASLWYSAAAEAAAASGDMQLLAKTHVFHAVCMLRTYRYEQAIASANMALRAFPDCPEAFHYRGLALYSENNIRGAVADLKKSLELSPDEREVQQFHSNISKLLRQLENKEYDLREFFLQGCKPEEAPEWADFNSEAIEIGMTGDGRGRGVFLNRDVKLGELLMVSNPLVSAVSLEDLYCISLWCCGSGSWIRTIFRLLQQDDPIPNIRDFDWTNAGDHRWNDEGLDVQKSKKTVDMASRLSFKISRISSSVTSKQVFGLPNFINHCCLPNSSLVVVGGAIFVRAATSIQAGEEITISYIDCLQPLATRAKMLSKAGWDFTCGCKRCKAETRYKAQLQGVPWHPVSSLEGYVKRVEKLESVLGKLKSITEEERGMIQVGHIQAYLQVAGNKAESNMCRQINEKFKLLSEIEAMMLLRRFVPGHGKAIALIARIVRRYVLNLEWHPSFEVEFDAAMVAMIGDISLPPVDYITLLDHLESDENVSDLFGAAACG